MIKQVSCSILTFGLIFQLACYFYNRNGWVEGWNSRTGSCTTGKITGKYSVVIWQPSIFRPTFKGIWNWVKQMIIMNSKL